MRRIMFHDFHDENTAGREADISANEGLAWGFAVQHFFNILVTCGDVLALIGGLFPFITSNCTEIASWLGYGGSRCSISHKMIPKL